MNKLLKSFGFAFHGLRIVFSEHRNLIIQLVAGILVIILAVVLKISLTRMSILLIIISQVLALEMINTALERYIDKITPENDRDLGIIKDILAGAVLLTAIFSIIIGIIIFYNPILG